MIALKSAMIVFIHLVPNSFLFLVVLILGFLFIGKNEVRVSQTILFLRKLFHYHNSSLLLFFIAGVVIFIADLESLSFNKLDGVFRNLLLGYLLDHDIETLAG
jgi:hypothetical protein